MFRYLLYINFILLLSCENIIIPESEIIDAYVQKHKNERVRVFNVTECLTECFQDSGKLISQSLDSNILKLEIGHWMNCAISLNRNVAGFDYENGVLDLRIIDIPSGVKIKDEDTLFYYEYEACECYFIFNFELIGFDEIPDSILINNKPINNIGVFGTMLNQLSTQVEDTLKTKENARH